MALALSILRLLLPLVVILALTRFIMPRYQHARKQQSSRIDVDAEVVNSEQNIPSDIPYTPYTTQSSRSSALTDPSGSSGSEYPGSDRSGSGGPGSVSSQSEQAGSEYPGAEWSNPEHPDNKE